MSNTTIPGSSGAIPKSVKPLPDSVKEDAWKKWPRKTDAHLLWKLRPRQIDAQVARKRIELFLCPDQTIRIPLEQMLTCFGPQPAEIAMVERAQAPAPIAMQLEDIDDPIALMFRESVNMWKAAGQQIENLLKLTTDPMNAAIQAMKDALSMANDTNALLAARVTELEQARDTTLKEREDAIDNRHMRDLVLNAELAKEERRKKITDSFVSQLPIFMAKWTGGTLSDFVTQYSAQEWELLFTTGFVKPEQQAIVRDLLARQAIVKAAEEKKRAAAAGSQPAAAPEVGGKAQHDSAVNGIADQQQPATGGN